MEYGHCTQNELFIPSEKKNIHTHIAAEYVTKWEVNKQSELIVEYER